METKRNYLYISLSIALMIAIAAVIFFVIIPNLSITPQKETLEEINFSTSDWIEQYAEQRVGIYGKDFFTNTAFSYNIRSNKMIVTYASQNSIEEVRDFYLSQPGAELTGRNDETSLHITLESDGQTYRVYNYYSPIARVIELELTLDPVQAEQVIGQLEQEFPADQLAKFSEIRDIISGDVFGGYVRYRYDNFDKFSYPSTPIFSRAYLYEGTEDEFARILSALNAAYPEHRHDESQEKSYYKTKQMVLSLSFVETDANETIVTISLQEIPAE